MGPSLKPKDGATGGARGAPPVGTPCTNRELNLNKRCSILFRSSNGPFPKNSGLVSTSFYGVTLFVFFLCSGPFHGDLHLQPKPKIRGAFRAQTVDPSLRNQILGALLQCTHSGRMEHSTFSGQCHTSVHITWTVTIEIARGRYCQHFVNCKQLWTTGCWQYARPGRQCQ